MATAQDPFVKAPLNPTITFASSADDLVSFYRQAVQGELFEHEQTLNVLRAVLSIGDVVWGVPLPLGATSFGKGGSFDIPGFHALSAPGALFFDDVWVYFAFALNWTAPDVADPATMSSFLRASAEALQLVKDLLAAPLTCDAGTRLPETR